MTRMKLYRKKYKLIETYGAFLMDLFAILLAYFVAHRLRILLPFGAKVTNETLWFPIYFLCIMGCIFYNLMMNRYEGFFRRGYFVEFEEILKYNVIQFVFLSTCVYLFRLELDFSRLMLVYFVICNALVGYLFRIVFKIFINKTYKKGRGSEKVLIVTDPERLEQVKTQIQKDRGWNYEVVGVAICNDRNDDFNHVKQKRDFSSSKQEISEWQIVANENNILDVARQMPIDLVLFCLPQKMNGNEIDEVRGIQNGNAQELEEEYRDVALSFLENNQDIQNGKELVKTLQL